MKSMWSPGRRRPVVIAATAAAVAAIPASALMTSGVAQGAPSSKANLYIVQTAGSPVATYAGGVAGFAATKPAEGARVDSKSKAATSYASRLRSDHAAVLAKARVAANAKRVDYSVAFNGFAAKLTEAEATRLRKTNGVLQVWKDEIRKADTVSTPGFLGLDGAAGAWATKFGGWQHAGEGQIVGILDTGFWPESPSFAALPEPRHDAYKIASKWHGTCVAGDPALPPGDSALVTCNNKVIGARFYHEGVTVQPFEFLSPRDYNGHGSHTGSTAAGNHGVAVSINGGAVGTASGMAPQARLAYYKGLWALPDGTASGSTVDLVHAIDDAVADGVDVINYSISGSSSYVVTPDELAFLNAAEAGVFVSTSAGNSGDTVGASSVAHNSPWTTTVAASSHDRGAAKTVTLGNGATYSGVGVGLGVGPAPVVDSASIPASGAGALAASLCFLDADSNPDNGTQPSIDPALAAGKIVVCTRGTNARVDKSAAVKAAGGVGMILANASDTQTFNADFHAVPSIHINATDGAAVRSYITGTPTPTATISAADTTPVRAPAMASFSSYGPALAGGGDLLKPDITAPGVDVVAAVSPAGDAGGNLYNAESGTSMSAPHVAGLAALVGQAQPRFSPMAIKSALMTTATPLDNTGAPIQRGAADATPLDYGAGHVRPGLAFNPGLVYDSHVTDWLRYACGIGQLQLVTDPGTCDTIGSIDPSNLNYPSIAVGDLAGSQTVHRKVRNMDSVSGSYTAQVQAPPGFTAKVTPASLFLKPKQAKSFTVKLTRTTAVIGQWTFGSLTWVGNHGQQVRSPIALRPAATKVPTAIDVTGASGSTPVEATPGYTGTLTAAVAGLAPAHVDTVPTTLATNSTVDVVIPAGTTVARFATFDADYSAGTDIDIVVRKDGVQVGSSGGPTAEESVTLENPAAGTYTVEVDLFDGPDPTNVLVNTFAVGSTSLGNLTAAPASQSVTGGQPATVTLAWSGLTPGTRYLGTVTYGDGTTTVGRTLVSATP